MAELINSINNPRVFFRRGRQKEFLQQIFKRIPIRDAARLCHLSERTLRDWRREKLSVSFPALKVLCRKTKVTLPKNIELKDRYWYTANGSSAGGIAVYKKYGRIGGDPNYRKKRWYEWWKREGKFKYNVPFPIKKPKRSEDLSEFVGIIMGDGGITKRQVIITLHYQNDREYSKFVISLVKRLFDAPVGTYLRKRESAINFIISRSELVKFCTEKLGLKIGNKVKQLIDIPYWIKRNRRYAIACVRGLIDTDGCIFAHRYKVNGKWYTYKKLAFTSYSKPLLYSVAKIIREIGLQPRFARKGEEVREVRIDSIKDVKQYFQIVGSHHPEHLKKYQK